MSGHKKAKEKVEKKEKKSNTNDTNDTLQAAEFNKDIEDKAAEIEEEKELEELLGEAD